MKIQENLIYLCGPHGSGKTTFAKELQKEYPEILIPELLTRNAKFNTHPEYRQVLKICGKAAENFECLEIAKKNPDRIVLGNRCIYDTLAYNWVYFSKGWISEERYEKYNMHARDFFRDENENPRAIVLNPGFPVVLRHLNERWKREKKKWNEDDLEYTRLACESFEKYNRAENIFYIDHEIDLEFKVDARETKIWIDYIMEKQLLTAAD